MNDFYEKYYSKTGFALFIDKKLRFISFNDVDINNKDDVERFEQLYISYDKEINEYFTDKYYYKKGSVVADSKKYDGLYYTYFMLEDKPIGFIISQQVEKTFFISQFYIVPEYRCKGIGSRIANLIVSIKSNNDGVIVYYVADKNERALKFWDRVMQQNHLVDGEDNLYKSLEETTKFVKVVGK